MLNKDFQDLINKFLDECGVEILDDPVKTRSLLSDYSRGKSKPELRLFIHCIGKEFHKRILEANDLELTSRQIVQALCADGKAEDKSQDMVDLLCRSLRADYTPPERPNPEPPEPKPESQSAPAAPVEPPKPAPAVTTEELLRQADAAYKAADYAKAVECWSKAAEAGNAEAQYNLGSCYEDGRGVPQDKAKAVEWWGKAAAKGCNHAAQYKLGWAYQEGYGVPQDYLLAAQWYAKAADQYDKKAEAALEKVLKKLKKPWFRLFHR